MSNYFSFIFILALLVFQLSACGSEQAPSAATETNTPTSSSLTDYPAEGTSDAADALYEQDILYPWVDQLNLRAEPDATAKVVTKVKEGAPLTFTGEKSAQNEQLTLRGITFDEPWVKVTTPDGQTGWVFLGAVKQAGENKGRPLSTKNVIDLPLFGRYDLNKWQLQTTQNKSAGDAEGFTKIYTYAGETLEISEIEMGEYGYARTQVLKDRSGQVVRKRELDFTVDPEFMLTEKVYDYQIPPGKLYSRSQRFKKHFMQLNARPEMVDGSFRLTDLKSDSEAASDGELKLETFSYEEWPQTLQGNDGCSCSFRPDQDNTQTDVFASNLGKQACIKMNGEMLLLTGGRTDRRMDYYNQSYSEAWITLDAQNGFYLFDKKINTTPENWYNTTREELIKTLLVMDQIPTEVPVKKIGEIGMGTRAEFSDMCSEALEMAQQQRRNGSYGIPIKMVYSNDRYSCEIVADITGQTDGGGDTYSGKLTLKTKDGNVLLTQQVWGDCGC